MEHEEADGEGKKKPTGQVQLHLAAPAALVHPTPHCAHGELFDARVRYDDWKVSTGQMMHGLEELHPDAGHM